MAARRRRRRRAARPRARPRRSPRSRRPPRSSRPRRSSRPPRSSRRTTQQQTQPAPGAQAKSDDPVALNDQGFALIGQGKATDAVAPLQRSVEAFRAQDRKGDIGYAYALYNLGNALRLSGRPAEAIPFLEERLQVSDYKRGVVKKELETARKQAG
jgi:serine/threonine-protein kinase